MANGGSLDLLIQGLRSAGTGIQQGAQGFQQAQTFKSEQEDRERKRIEADEQLAARGVLAEAVPGITEKIAGDPEFTRDQFEQEITGFTQQAITSRDPSSLQALQGLRQTFDRKEAAAAAGVKTKAAKKKEEREITKIKRDRETDQNNQLNKRIKPREDFLTKVGKIEGIASKGVENMSGIDQISMINAFQRLIDDAVVRKEDVSILRSAQSSLDEFKTFIAGIRKGDKLSPEQVQSMLEATARIAQPEIDRLNATIGEFENRAASFEIDRDNVIGAAGSQIKGLSETFKKRLSGQTAAGRGKKLGSGQTEEFLARHRPALDKWSLDFERKFGRPPTPAQRSKAAILSARKGDVDITDLQNDLIEDFKQEDLQTLQQGPVPPGVR